MNQLSKFRAREKLREYIRRWRREGSPFHTGIGRPNHITKIDKQNVCFKTEVSVSPIVIPIKKIREAMSYIFYKRTSTRKELEPFSKYSSLLLGLLHDIFTEIATITKATNRILRITLRGTRFYFSGTDKSVRDMELIHKNNGRNLLLSYFYLRDCKNERWKDFITEKNDVRILLDSGSYSVYNAMKKGKQVKPIDLKEYAAFVEQHIDLLDGYMNLDNHNDPETTWRNFEYLSKRVGKDPIPVWIPNDSWETLEQLVASDRHDVIAIGGTVFLHNEEKKRQLFNRVFTSFPVGRFHLLGGSSGLLFSYNWFSADSTSHLNPRKNDPPGRKTIITPSGYQLAPKEWTTEQCMGFSIQTLASIEEAYNGFQIEGLLQPGIPTEKLDPEASRQYEKQKSIQLSLFNLGFENLAIS